MGYARKRLCTLFIILIVIVGTSGTDPNDMRTDENHQTPGGRRVVKMYSGPRPNPIVCAGEGFQADPHNCAIFYRCIKSAKERYTVFRFQCGPGTVYDPENEVCIHPRDTRRSECGGHLPPIVNAEDVNDINSIPAVPLHDQIDNEIPSPLITDNGIYVPNHFTTTPSTLSSQTNPYPWGSPVKYVDGNIMATKLPNTVNNIPQSTTDNICAADGFVGDSENCHKFYRCVANQRGGFTRFEFSCSENTVWDDDIQACNHIWAVKRTNCGLVSDKTKSMEHVPYSENSNSEPSVKENKSRNPVQKQLQISYGTRATQIQNQIGNGLLNQNQTQIHYGDKLDYNNNKGNQQTQTQISNGPALSQSQMQIDYGNEGVQTQLQIDHSNQASQNQIQISGSTTTDSVSSTRQESNELDSTLCTEDGYIADPSNCQKFYRCMDNGQGGFKKIGFSCAEGTAWDTTLNTCNHASANKGGCKTQVESTTQAFTSTTYKTSSYHPTISTENYDNILNDKEDTGYDGSEPEVTPVPVFTTSASDGNGSTDTNCTTDGFIGDDNNCKIFYRCVQNNNGGFTKYVFSCGEGTVWDPAIQTCNHAWAVEKCGGNSSPDIQKVDSTTPKLTTIAPVYTSSTSSTGLGIDYEENLQPGYGNSNNDIQTTTTSSERPSNVNSQLSDSKCKTSGFIADKYDCKKFYRCVDDGIGGFTRYEFTCGDGTLWDNEITACNHASAVTGCGTTIKNPKEENTATLADNTVITTPTSKPITTSSTTENPKDENTVDVAGNTIITTTASKPITTSSTTESMSTSDSRCTQSGFMGDRKDCKKFYRCVDDGKGSFTKFEFVCGEGTVWDDEINSCNHAWAVTKCGSSSLSPVKEENNIPSSVNSESQLSTTTSNMLTTDSVNSETSTNCTEDGYIGDPNNCQLFYRCLSNGKNAFLKYQYSCEEGTSWNQEMLSCDHSIDNKRCGSGLGDISTTKIPDGFNEVFTESTTVSKNENLNPTQSPPISTDKCTSEGFFGDKLNCKKFYRCVNDGQGGYIKYDFNCGEGTVWDQDLLTCNHESDTKCSSEGPQTTESQPVFENVTTATDKEDTSSKLPSSDKPNDVSDASMASDDCPSEGLFPNRSDCQKFYRCADVGDGTYTKFEYACGEGLAWDSESQTCISINDVPGGCQSSGVHDEDKKPTSGPVSNVTQKPTNNLENSTNSNSSNVDTCNSEGYFGNTQDCKKFYRCVNNGNGGYTKYDFVCADGTIWDVDVTNCNHADVVTKPSCRQSQNSSTETGNSHESSNKPNCTRAGFYADPNDCKKFYRCVDWDGNGTNFSIFHFDCGEGTIWDPAVETCNHENSVYPPRNCNGSQSPSTEGTTTLRTESTTESNTTKEYVTDSTTETTTRLTTQSLTESTTTLATTHLTTSNIGDQTTTERSKESTTENSVENTTPEPIQSTTSQPAESTTTPSVESTTSQPAESTTSQPAESTTTPSVESTTSQPAESTTTPSVQSTTLQPVESTTTPSVQSTTLQPAESTTTPSVQSTTEYITDITTQQSGESTTQQQASTTEQSIENTTTESAVGSTTEQSRETTEQSSASTTIKPDENTTENSGENTTTDNSVIVDGMTTEKPTEKPLTEDCPSIDDDQNLFVCPTSFRRHPKYCNMFYQCDENDDSHDLKIAVFACPNNTIYDEKQIKCVKESKSEKPCNGQIAQKHRVKRKDSISHHNNDPIVASHQSYACTTTGYYAFEKDGDCSPGFLKCTNTKSNKLRGLVYQCPPGFLFWTVSRRCEPVFKIGDCKRSYLNDWSGRWEIPVERKNVAW